MQPNLAPNNTRPLLLLIALTSLNQCCYAGVSFALTLYAVKLHASPFAIGLLIALFSFFAALTSVIAGKWADRVGARLPMLAASVAMVAGAGIAFFWHELAALFAVSVVVGTSYNTYFIAQQQLLGRWGSLDDRVRTFSMSGLGLSLANFVGPLGVGIALNYVDYPEAFLMLAFIPVVPVLFIAMGRLPIPAGGAGTREGGGARRGGVLDLLRERELRLIYATALFGSVTSQLFSFLMPLRGIGLGFSAFDISLVIGSFALASAVSRLVVSFFTRRFTPWSMLIGALAVAAVCFAVLAFLTELVSMLLVAFGIGFCFGICNPVAQALLYEAAPAHRVGEVLGLRVMMAGGMNTAVPLGAGALSAVVGIGPIFGAFSVLLAGCCYANRDRMRRRPGAAIGR